MCVCIVTVLAVVEEVATRDEGFGDFLSLPRTKIIFPSTLLLLVAQEIHAVGLEEKIGAINGVLARF